jgi:hypothetical protein
MQKNIVINKKVPPKRAVIGCVPIHNTRQIPKKMAFLFLSVFKSAHRKRKK